MAKEKPGRTGAVEDAIKELTREKIEVLDATKDNVHLLKISDIKELTLEDGTVMYNRLSCSKDKLSDLAENIAKLHKEKAGLFGTGILQAILVRKNNRGVYERVFGFSRISALKINRQEEVPAMVVENMSDELARFIRSSENLNREDLNPYDETYSIMEHLMLVCDFETIEEVKSFLNKIKNYKTGKVQTLKEKEIELLEDVENLFKRIGRYEALTFVDRMNILDINPMIKEAMVDGYVNYTQATIIKSKAKNDEEIKKVLSILRNKKMTASEVREFFKNLHSIEEPKSADTLSGLYENVKKLSKTPKKLFSRIGDADKEKLKEHLEQIELIFKKANS